jgi:hypothetical protein
MIEKGRAMRAAISDDTNPMRSRGRQLITSLALRVSMECATIGRGGYISVFLVFLI